MLKLREIWELYNRYVSDCLMFDDSPSEIMGFDDYAHLHHGVDKSLADHFLQYEA